MDIFNCFGTPHWPRVDDDVTMPTYALDYSKWKHIAAPRRKDLTEDGRDFTMKNGVEI